MVKAVLLIPDFVVGSQLFLCPVPNLLPVCPTYSDPHSQVIEYYTTSVFSIFDDDI